MAYASACDVAALCRNLLGNASNFESSTSPNVTQINMWLSAGCALINTTIFGRNYTQAVPPNSAAYDFIAMANAQYAAWMAERSRTLASVQASERTRGDMFKRDFNDSLALIKTLSLGQAGVSQQSNVYTGGISQADKQAEESNQDRVAARFVRGQMTDQAAPREGDLGSTYADPQQRGT
jgi:hypothetical protein